MGDWHARDHEATAQPAYRCRIFDLSHHCYRCRRDDYPDPAEARTDAAVNVVCVAPALTVDSRKITKRRGDRFILGAQGHSHFPIDARIVPRGERRYSTHGSSMRAQPPAWRMRGPVAYWHAAPRCLAAPPP